MAGELDAADTLTAAADDARTVADLAALLRQLRRRSARRQQESELTYRRLAGRTGWSQAAIGEYFTGRTLPPTDRFDVLTALLGASPAEQGALAGARDRAEEALRAPRRGDAGPGVPRQLPADVAGFTGRTSQLAELDALLAGTGRGPAVVISALSGTAGVGKTALAVHWAHRVAEEFPDGQLYLNLRGFDPGGQALAPTEAVRAFLETLGVPAERIPTGLDAQAALYRSRLAGRRVLIVLDNAREAEQVRPLLPGTPTALVLVTSRNQLTSLVATDGARPVTLDLLSSGEARELLAGRLGPDRVAAQTAAAEQIIARCAGLPLALTVAAARAATRPAFPLAVLADELATAGGRLDALSAGDPATDVRAVFSWSVAALTPAAARLFRLLGLHPGPDLTAPAAASLAGQPLPQVRSLLAELTGASLVAEPSPGRYSCHDLLRAYAAELAQATDGEADRQAASRRLLDHYVHTGYAAEQLVSPHSDPIVLPPADPAPGVVPEPLADVAAAATWLAAEHRVLIAALGWAARAGFPAHSWQLTWAVDTFLDRTGRWAELAAAWQVAADAADRLGHVTGCAYAHRNIGQALAQLGQYPRADVHHRAALDWYARAGDDTGQAHVLYNLSYLYGEQGRLDEAVEHASQALAGFRAAGHRRGQAAVRTHLGWCHTRRGDLDQALSCCRQALALFEEAADPVGVAHAQYTLGRAYHRMGRHAAAVSCYRHALAQFQAVGDRYNEADTLSHLGDSRQAAGDTAEAAMCWQQAAAILTELDHPDAAAVAGKLARLDRVADRAGSA